MRRLVPGHVVGKTRTCVLVLEDVVPIRDARGRIVGRRLITTHVSRSKTYKP